MSITINGSPVALPDDPRVSLLDLLREHPASVRRQEGLQPGRLRRVHRAGRRRARAVVPGAGRAVRGPLGHHRRRARAARRAAPPAAGLRRTRRLPVRLLHAGPDLLGGGHGATSCARAFPATSRATSGRRPSRSARDELRERMSGNVCRCGAYNGIVAAICRDLRRGAHMNPFTYVRAQDAADACNAAARPGAKYLGGGTNLVDLMRETIEHPVALVDVTGLSRDIEEQRRRQPADRRGRRATRRWPRTMPCARATRCWPGPSRPARRRRSATWRPSAATCCSARAAPISTTTRARAATSAARGRGATPPKASTAITPSWAPRRAALPRIRRTCAWRSPRSARWCTCAMRAANARCRSPTCIACPRTVPRSRRCSSPAS
jgi:hypothetical protein